MDKQDLSQIKSIIQENNVGLLAKVQEMIKEALFQFWEQVIEPNVVMKADIENMATKSDIADMATKSDIADMATKTDIARLERKLDAAVSTQDNLEPRVRKLESKVF